MTPFERELISKLVSHLKLEDVDLEGLSSDTRLFGSGLELDSIDAIEIEVLVKKEWGIEIHQSERNESTFSSLGALAQFIEQHRNRDAKVS
ncbi:MAG: phosphopantetheine-binding protein [Myxococcota bacterium]|jgi:acyl carrier protein|nr:phosphopantetheine-binding protein [Myxococcota bacterium]